jgi:cell division protein FtsL
LAVVARRRRRARLASVLVLLVVVLMFFGSVAFHAMIVENQSRLDQADGRIAELEQQRQDLKVQLAALESPDRILAFALQRLGMVEPPDGAVIVLQPVGPEVLGSPREGQ